MKKLLGFMAVLGFAFVLSVGSTGCSKPKDTKKTTTATTTTPTAKEEKLVVAVDSATATGDNKEEKVHKVKVTVTRQKDAGEKDGKLEATADPKEGITLKFDKEALAGKEKEVKAELSITVAKGAKKGDVKVTIKATAEGATAGEGTVTVTITEAKVETPVKDYSVDVKADKAEVSAKKADKTAKLTFHVKMGADAGKVALTAWAKDKDGKDEGAKEVTVKVDAEMAKAGDAVATVSFEKAAPGDYWIFVKGAGAEGKKDSEAKVKLTITEK